MDTHKNAPLTPKGREAMVRSVSEGGSCPWCGLDMARRPADIMWRRKTTPIHELERYMCCRHCSELQGYPFERSHWLRCAKTNYRSRSATPNAIAGVVRGFHGRGKDCNGPRAGSRLRRSDPAFEMVSRANPLSCSCGAQGAPHSWSKCSRIAFETDPSMHG